WSGRPRTADSRGWLATGACGLRARELAVLQPPALLLPFRWRARVGATALALDDAPSASGVSGEQEGRGVGSAAYAGIDAEGHCHPPGAGGQQGVQAHLFVGYHARFT
ncbi:unnamed protein product, partial [Urochloa humidicola]